MENWGALMLLRSGAHSSRYLNCTFLSCLSSKSSQLCYVDVSSHFILTAILRLVKLGKYDWPRVTKELHSNKRP